jgi:ribosome silencing factor RsfS/YbeB/iojap/nicotinate (nicotinamide) nucleotide adenylyltransferase
VTAHGGRRPPNPRHGAIWDGCRIGLLGGSFNPAHEGHRHISLEMIKRLGLDAVWWLVSPQNPLKAADGMAPLVRRLACARDVARHPRIVVTALESALGTRFTAETLARLRARFPATRFVWIMGADNLTQIPRWQHWTRIFAAMPVAVHDRPSYSLKSLEGLAARRYASSRIDREGASGLISARPPAWTFVLAKRHPVSATALRTVGGAISFRTPAAPDRADMPTGRGHAIHPEIDRPTEATIHHHPVRRPEADHLSRLPGSLVGTAVASLEDDKAEDIRVIDLMGRSSVADGMIVASGRSSRQVAAMADHLIQRLKPLASRPVAVEGQQRADWVLIDAGDVIVHLFRPEVRAFYQLEKMWDEGARYDAAAATAVDASPEDPADLDRLDAQPV